MFVSEIGDKTFFIAGLLAMKTSRLISFTGSMAALSVMTIISVLIGQVFHAIPSGLAGGFKFDQWVAVIAFSYFGLKTLKVGGVGGWHGYLRVQSLFVNLHDNVLFPFLLVAALPPRNQKSASPSFSHFLTPSSSPFPAPLPLAIATGLIRDG